MMRLREALASLESLDSDAVIYAAEPWAADSQALVGRDGSPEAIEALASGMSYVLEVRIASEVLEVWSAWRDGRVPNADERCEAVIHYAVSDAYLEAS